MKKLIFFLLLVFSFFGLSFNTEASVRYPYMVFYEYLESETLFDKLYLVVPNTELIWRVKYEVGHDEGAGIEPLGSFVLDVDYFFFAEYGAFDLVNYEIDTISGFYLDMSFLDNYHGEKLFYFEIILEGYDGGYYELLKMEALDIEYGLKSQQYYAISTIDDVVDTVGMLSKNYEYALALEYARGRAAGYAEALQEEGNGNLLFLLMSSLWSFISLLGGWEILPGFKIVYLVGLVVVFGLVYFILGKRKN